MAGCPRRGEALAICRVVLCLGALGLASAEAQTRLTLAQLNQRQPPDFKPVYLNQKVLVEGVVNASALHFPGYTELAFDDGTGGGILGQPASGPSLDDYRPGDAIRVLGTVSQYSGMTVVLPERIEVTGQKPVPAPIPVALADLQDFRYLGRLVRTEGRIKSVGDTVSGPSITFESPDPFWVFLPQAQDEKAGQFSSFGRGDLVEATGIASQYCPRPPYNHSFEVLALGPESVLRKDRALALPPVVIASGLTLILLVGFFLWSRERRLRNQRERLRKTYQLGEEILGAASVEAIWKRIAETLPTILGITRVHLYVYNRAAKTLDGVAEESGEAVSVSLSAPPAGTQSGAAACFHYRTLLVIPDIARCPFPIATPDNNAPQSLLFVPMMAQGEVIGVMELDQDDRMRDFSADEQALAQHLGNQIGAALRLLGQRTVQEQLFRTEKMAAVGRLISGVVNELQMPLQSITELAGLAMGRESGTAERNLEAIAAEAQKASAMVARLVSYAAAEQQEARPVSISALLHTLIEFREGDWKASGIRFTEMISSEALNVLGSHGQLEQVFLNLLVHAEQALAEAPKKLIAIRTSLLARRLLVEISFSALPESGKPEEAASILGVTRSVVAGHGGEVRLIQKPNTDPRFEVEFPLAARDRTGSSTPSTATVTRMEPGRRMTALVIEPEDSAQRHLIGLLSARGYRVVPLVNADNGLDLASRVRFDVAFCSVHAPGLNWVELSERLHSRVGGFVLLSEGYDAELSNDFGGDGQYVLPKPVQESELDNVLHGIEITASNKVINIRNIVA